MFGVAAYRARIAMDRSTYHRAINKPFNRIDMERACAALGFEDEAQDAQALVGRAGPTAHAPGDAAPAAALLPPRRRHAMRHLLRVVLLHEKQVQPGRRMRAPGGD